MALANDHAKNFEAAISAYKHAISIMQTSIGQCSDAEAAGLKEVVVELESKIVEAREELTKKPAVSGGLSVCILVAGVGVANAVGLPARA